MKIIELIIRPDINQTVKLVYLWLPFKKLLAELRKKDLTNELILSIDNGIEQINTISDSEKELQKGIGKNSIDYP